MVEYKAAAEKWCCVSRPVVHPPTGRSTGTGLQFRHDPRVTVLSLAILQQTEVIKTATNGNGGIGWPPVVEIERMLSAVKPAMVEIKPSGSHHFHADPAYGQCNGCVLQFQCSNTTVAKNILDPNCSDPSSRAMIPSTLPTYW
jgi:hypothetical protein